MLYKFAFIVSFIPLDIEYFPHNKECTFVTFLKKENKSEDFFSSSFLTLFFDSFVSVQFFISYLTMSDTLISFYLYPITVKHLL